jgi:hypothetical protein
MDNETTQLTTRDIDDLTQRINYVFWNWRVFAGTDTNELYDATSWRDRMIKDLHSVTKPSRRPHAMPVILDVLTQTLNEMEAAFYMLEDAQQASGARTFAIENSRLAREAQALQAQVATLEQQLAAAQAEGVAWRERALAAAPASVTIPAQTVTVRSKIDREILRLIATTGLARSWHVITRIVAAGLTEHENGVRNALKRLKESGLLTDFTWNGKVQQWKPRAGGGRQLLRLTERGQTWAEMAFKVTALPCELDDMVQKHKGVEHAVGILEARDWLAAMGFDVDMEPEARPFDEGEPWGARVEPDLTATLQGVLWPVEVQREVHERNGDKWRKAVELYGRLMLVVFSEQACEKQVALLKVEMARWEWPVGSIQVCSLEAIERGDQYVFTLLTR